MVRMTFRRVRLNELGNILYLSIHDITDCTDGLGELRMWVESLVDPVVEYDMNGVHR